jgi:dihydrofolate reductase
MIIGIVAVDQNGAIGKGGTLPWHYSADMKFFKETTTGHACVMGYRTWLSLKRPLPNRLNIVLSRQAEIGPRESVIVMRDIESVLSMTGTLPGDLFVIGGAQVYQALLPYIEKWIVTHIPFAVEGADAFVPTDYLAGFSPTDSREIDDGLEVTIYNRDHAE